MAPLKLSRATPSTWFSQNWSPLLLISENMKEQRKKKADRAVRKEERSDGKERVQGNKNDDELSRCAAVMLYSGATVVTAWEARKRVRKKGWGGQRGNINIWSRPDWQQNKRLAEHRLQECVFPTESGETRGFYTGASGSLNVVEQKDWRSQWTESGWVWIKRKKNL